MRRARIFFKSPELVAYLADHFPLIYTVRDPRAILRSIVSQNDSSAELKAERWEALVQNYLVWKPFLKEPNLLVVRYEDLLIHPIATMHKVYDHLNLPHSLRFLEPFPRLFPERFLWETSVARDSGVKKEFDTEPDHVMERDPDGRATGTGLLESNDRRVHAALRL